MAGFRGFLCTHQEMNVTVVYRCVSPGAASVVRVFHSSQEQDLLLHPALTYCCEASCCSAPPPPGGEKKPRLTYSYGQPSPLGEGIGAARLWSSLLGLLVVLLAIFMIFQNVISFKRTKRILPLLQKESAGPYSDTVVKDGIILPRIAYREPLPAEVEDSGGGAGGFACSEGRREGQVLQPLNPSDLLAQSWLGEEGGKIIEEEEGGLERGPRDRSGEGEHDLVSSEVPLVPPLAPAYYPGRQVRRLWQGGLQDNNLYRYTHLDRLVYPPGYIV